MRKDEKMKQQGDKKGRDPYLRKFPLLKEKKRRLETDFEALKHSADSYADKAESTGRLTSIAKSNGMRRTAREKRVTVKNW